MRTRTAYTSIAIDPTSGNLIVSAGQPSYLITSLTGGAVISILAGVNASAGNSDGPATSAKINTLSQNFGTSTAYQNGVTVDFRGIVHVADTNRIRRVLPYSCPVGTYFSGMSCLSCPVGSQQLNTLTVSGIAVCWTCPAGMASPVASSPCTACAAGTFSATAGSGSCTPCTAGSYTPFGGATACQLCPAGYISAAGSVCTPCSAGTFAAAAGSSVCTPCASGTVSATGATACGDVAMISSPFVRTVAGTGTSGSADTTGTAASFNNPAGVAMDGSGNIFVVDRGNYKARMRCLRDCIAMRQC